MEIFYFFMGVLYVYTRHNFCLVFLGICSLFAPNWRWLFFALAGLSYAWVHQTIVSPSGFPKDIDRFSAQVEGIVISLPKNTSMQSRFLFKIKQINNQSADGIAQLSCYRCFHKFKAGEHYRFNVKLKKPRNLVNPGSFDVVKMLFAKHVHWSGYVYPKSIQQQIPSYHGQLLRWRQKLADQIASKPIGLQTIAIIQALTLGDTSNLGSELWALFRTTGTIHLLVISGAHIGFVAGLVFFVFQGIWRLSARLCIVIPAYTVGAVVAIFAALFYAVLSGFSVPAQRALVMCCFLFWRYVGQNHYSTWQVWQYALFVVLLIEPHSVLLPGFYLSFIAVAILMIANHLIKTKGMLKAVYMQLACLIGLLPLTLHYFSYAAINGFFANIVAIPWVSFLIVPGAMIALISAWIPFCTPIFTLLEYGISSLIYYLNLVNKYIVLNFQWAWIEPIAVCLALSAVYLVIVIRNRYSIVLGCICLGMAFYPNFTWVPMGAAVIDVLDVGQGLAIAIRTTNHVLLYDTGGGFPGSSDIGSMVIHPYLQAEHLNHIDGVIISHPDLDHRGGWPTIRKIYAPSNFWVDNPDFYKEGLACHKAKPWVWDNVAFSFIALNNTLHGKNNSSCILQVEAFNKKMLLTGDIEKPAERYLLRHAKSKLNSDVLLVAHHGSKTSSSQSFIKAVAPKHAIISRGYQNRYRFPHKPVIDRLKKNGIQIWDTASHGMVRVFINEDTLKVVAFEKKYNYLL